MCSENLIGIKDCSYPEPVTGIYIDELGINKSFLSQLITDQYNSGVELFEEKRAFAWRKLTSDILTRLSEQMKGDTLIENKRIGQPLTDSSNIDLALGSGKYGGIRVKIDPNNVSFLEYYLADLFIDLSELTLNTQVLVFNMNTGKLIDTIDYLTGGVEQFLGRKYLAKRKILDLAFVYESIENTTKYITKKGSCSDCGGRVRETHICPFVDAVGIELTTDGQIVLSHKLKKYTQGMSFNYNVNCDRGSWLCSIGGLISLPLAYSTAVEIYDYALMVSPNQRVNTITSINFDNVKQARDIAAQRYSEELNAILGGIRLPDDNHCFTCRKNIKYVTALP